MLKSAVLRSDQNITSFNFSLHASLHASLPNLLRRHLAKKAVEHSPQPVPLAEAEVPGQEEHTPQPVPPKKEAAKKVEEHSPQPVLPKPKQKWVIIHEQVYGVRSSGHLAAKKKAAPTPPTAPVPAPRQFVMPPPANHPGGPHNFKCHLCDDTFTSTHTTSKHYQAAHSDER